MSRVLLLILLLIILLGKVTDQIEETPDDIPIWPVPDLAECWISGEIQVCRVPNKRLPEWKPYCQPSKWGGSCIPALVEA